MLLGDLGKGIEGREVVNLVSEDDETDDDDGGEDPIPMIARFLAGDFPREGFGLFDGCAVQSAGQNRIRSDFRPHLQFLRYSAFNHRCMGRDETMPEKASRILGYQPRRRKRSPALSETFPFRFCARRRRLLALGAHRWNAAQARITSLCRYVSLPMFPWKFLKEIRFSTAASRPASP